MRIYFKIFQKMEKDKLSFTKKNVNGDLTTKLFDKQKT